MYSVSGSLEEAFGLKAIENTGTFGRPLPSSSQRWPFRSREM